jgi:putative aldouronate transport system substrate-binding protein
LKSRFRLGLAATVSLLSMAAAIAQEPVPLKIFAAQFPDADLATNKFTELVEQKFGIDITFEVTSLDGGPAKEKRQITLASGDLPDAFFLIPWVDGFSRAEILRLGAEGALLPLNDLIEKYAPNVKAALAETPEFARLATAPDGQIYALPQWNDCYHCSYGSKLWINTAWLERLGLEMPKTTEDLHAVLTAFKNDDPNGNGIADEIPLTGTTTDSIVPFLMNAFIYDPRFSQQYTSTLALQGDQVVLNAAQDDWRDGLTYIAGLYGEGLIDPSAFTQNRDGMQAVGTNADAVLLGSATVLHPYMFVTGNSPDGRDADYDAVPPLTGPAGANYSTYVLPSSPQGTFALTYVAGEAQQQKAMELLDYLFTTEGRTLGYFGAEGGTGWRKPVEGDIALDPALTPTMADIQFPTGATPPNDMWSAAAQYYFPANVRNAEVQPMDLYAPEGYERRIFEATKLYDGHAPMDQIFPLWNVWFSAEDATELAQLQTNLDDYVTRTNAEFITGQRNITDDAAWAEYLQGLDGLGLPRYLELMQKAYDASAK